MACISFYMIQIFDIRNGELIKLINLFDTDVITLNYLKFVSESSFVAVYGKYSDLTPVVIKLYDMNVDKFVCDFNQLKGLEKIESLSILSNGDLILFNNNQNYPYNCYNKQIKMIKFN